MPEVAVALIQLDDRLLLQLRDFAAHIADPGQWGFFGGHLRRGETPEAGLRRELREELSWEPDELHPLGSFDTHDGKRIIGFKAGLQTSTDELRLGEGQEMAAFTIQDLGSGRAYSRRWNRTFPLTAITRRALHEWHCSTAS